MKKLVSFLILATLLIGFSHTVASAGDDFVDIYGFIIKHISTQKCNVYGNSTNKVFENAFILEFETVSQIPSNNYLVWSFDNNYNDGKDISALSLNITLVPSEDYLYCYGICDVVISGDVEPGVYYFQVLYDGVYILTEDTHDMYSVLTITEAPQVQDTATIADAGRSLSLSDIVYINDYARIIGTGDYTPEYIRSYGGLLVFTSEISEEAATYEAAQSNGYIVPGLVGGDGNEYAQRTKGITSVQYRNTYYLRIYLKLSDGTYIYTPLKAYGVHNYCTNKLADGSGASQGLKNVCQALLAYGDYASAYFGSGGTT